MPFVPVPNGVFASFRFTLEGQLIENGFWFDASGGGFGEAATFVGDTLGTIWWPAIREFLSIGLVAREVYIIDASTEDGPSATITVPAPVAGAVNTNAVPANSAYCVTLRTSGRGRSARGRSYVPGIAEGLVGGSILQAPALTGIVAAYEALRNATALVGLPYCVCSRFENGAPRAAGVLRPVTAVVGRDNVMDSQRRRLPGRGQ